MCQVGQDKRAYALVEGLWLSCHWGTLLTYTKFPPGTLRTWKVPHVLPGWAQGSNVATHGNIWRVVQVCRDIIADGGFTKVKSSSTFFLFIKKLKVVDWPMQTPSHPRSKIQTKPKRPTACLTNTEKCEWALLISLGDCWVVFRMITGVTEVPSVSQ